MRDINFYKILNMVTSSRLIEVKAKVNDISIKLEQIENKLKNIKNN